MAAKLQCEICGGKLIGKPGGIFECESCGTEYSTAWAKEKIQEIQGTVKVEGTVEVKGSVQVEGTVNAQSLVKRGYLALEDGKWDDAEKYFNDVLNIDPENAEAYLGIVMAYFGYHNRDEFAEQYIRRYATISMKNEFKRFLKFCDSDKKLKEWVAEIEHERIVSEEAAIKQIAHSRKQIVPYIGYIAAGYDYTLGIKENKSVVAVGANRDGVCDISDWMDIVAIASGNNHTIGLKQDGTVIAKGYSDDERCNVTGWKDIISIAGGNNHTVGLKSDGTVIAVGSNDQDQCNVSDWENITAIAAGSFHTVGLKSNGTVIDVGNKEGDKCDYSNWSDIISIAAGSFFTVGLKSNGTVLIVGDFVDSFNKVIDWSDIVEIVAGEYHVVGLKSDGSVVAAGNNDDGQCNVSNWENIIAVAASNHTVGLKSDGTVVAVGDNDDGQCNVSDWKLFKTEEEKQSDYTKACSLQESGGEKELAEAASIFSSLKDYQDSADRAAECDRVYNELKSEREAREKTEREAREAREKAEKEAAREKAWQEKIASLNAEKTSLQTELANLKGIFSGKRRKQIEARLAQIENELKRL